MTTAEEYLEGLHTRQLLNLRKTAYAVSNYGRYSDQKASVIVTPLLAVTLDQIKAELSKREHVPNKTEAKRIRQEKAKANRNK